MRVSIDPLTGQFDAAPLATQAGQPASKASALGLTQVVSPGGGTMVRLQDRFRSFVTAEVDANQRVTTDCRTTLADEHSAAGAR